MEDFPEEDLKDYQNHYRSQKSGVFSLSINYEFTASTMGVKDSEDLISD